MMVCVWWKMKRMAWINQKSNRWLSKIKNKSHCWDDSVKFHSVVCVVRVHSCVWKEKACGHSLGAWMLNDEQWVIDRFDSLIDGNNAMMINQKTFGEARWLFWGKNWFGHNNDVELSAHRSNCTFHRPFRYLDTKCWSIRAKHSVKHGKRTRKGHCAAMVVFELDFDDFFFGRHEATTTVQPHWRHKTNVRGDGKSWICAFINY